MVTYYLNRVFYPNLLPYQAETAFIDYLKDHPIPPEQLVFLNRNGYVVDLYYRTSIGHYFPEEGEQLPKELISGNHVFTDQKGIDQMLAEGIPFEEVQTFHHFRVTMLDGEFLNRRTRDGALGTFDLVKVPAY